MSKRITLIVRDRYGCPFRHVPEEETFGPAFEFCEHPKGDAMLCPSSDGGWLSKFPQKCPLQDGDVANE